MTPRCACGQPAPNSTICQACERDLTAALAGIPGSDGLAYHLAISLTRQAVTGAHAGSRSADTPLPYDPRVARQMAHLHGVMASWVRDLTEPA